MSATLHRGVAEKLRLWRRWGLWALLAGIGYFIFAWVGIATLFQPENVTTVWPPSGLLVGLLVVGGRRAWPSLLAGAFVGSLGASVCLGAQPWLSACVALANVVEAGLAAWLPELVRKAPLRLASVVDVLWFFLLAVLGAPAVGALLGGGVSAWMVGKPSWKVLHLWWMADGLGILLITPFILAVAQQRDGTRPWTKARMLEAVALLASLVLALALIYSWIAASPIILFPLVLWAALRFGVLGVASFMLPLSAMVFAEAALGYPMGSLLAAAYHLLDVQAFLSVTALSALGMAAAMEERRRVEQALLETQKRKDTFLAMLSHELRNPLAPIRNCLFILDRVLPQTEPARRALATIDRQVSYLTRLVGDLLDITRIEHNKIELRRELLDLRDVVRRTVDDHRPLFAAHKIELCVEPAHSPLWLDGDVTRLAQAFGNLLTNAIKFTPEGGQVTVALRREDHSASLSIRDTGVGLAPETMAHLFEPFTQADQSLDRRAGGLGLGLALAQSLVGLHGGRIHAHSAGLGQGSEFTVQLPTLSGREAASRGLVGTNGAAGGRNGLRVLVIEDSTDAAETLREALELNHHEVRVAADGPEGIARAREFRPHVVFCDIGLPGMNGYDVARAFRADDALRGIALVALTGYTSPEDRRKAAAAGFDRHVAKPPDLDVIERILSEVSV